MKIVEIMGGIQLPITNEEHDLMSKFGDDNSLNKQALSEREQVIINQLVMKNVLYRRQSNGQIKYFKQSGYREGS